MVAAAQWQWAVQAGWTIGERWQLVVQVSGQAAVNDSWHGLASPMRWVARIIRSRHLSVTMKKQTSWGDNRSRMEVGSSATEEKSVRRVAAVINVGLRPRRIWDGLDAAIMID
ncbi:hypothetical protein ACLOJK_036398 [Asimina triloba]